MKHIEPAARRAAGFVCGTEIPKKAAAENRFHSIMIQKSSPQAGACELLSLYFARYCTRYPVRIIRRILCQKV